MRAPAGRRLTASLLRGAVELAPRECRWECLACDQTAVTHEVRPHSRFHRCRGLAGLVTPFVPAGTRGKIEAREREDYVGSERVQTDADGRVIMSLVTTRDDGQDCTVFAPAAVGSAREMM
jgi:hypothetical protein